MGMKRSLGYRLAVVIIPALYGLVSRLLFASCRFRYHGLAHLRHCESHGPFIAAFWHYSVFNVLHLQRVHPQSWVAMVSGSRDAEFVAKVLARHNCETVRGSRHKGGIAALKQMIEKMRQGFNAAIVADGSQGPARKVQAGVILLAGKTGAPILPLVVAADRYWTFRSWDRSMLPKPFARLAIWYGEPMTVPTELTTAALEENRLQLEDRLNALYARAWEAQGRKEHHLD
jgi:lysophospholipid acyltransferase (LPLAT)-like uncharacterized protein